jgi:hypothetical protein
MNDRKNSQDSQRQPFGVECEDDWPMIPALIACGVINTLIFSIAIATI